MIISSPYARSRNRKVTLTSDVYHTPTFDTWTSDRYDDTDAIKVSSVLYPVVSSEPPISMTSEVNSAELRFWNIDAPIDESPITTAVSVPQLELKTVIINNTTIEPPITATASVTSIVLKPILALISVDESPITTAVSVPQLELKTVIINNTTIEPPITATASVTAITLD